MKRRDPYTGPVQWQRLPSAASHGISRSPPEGRGCPLPCRLGESMALAVGTVPLEATLCVVSAGSPGSARRVGGRRKGRSRPRAEAWMLKVQSAAWGPAERRGLSTPADLRSLCRRAAENRARASGAVIQAPPALTASASAASASPCPALQNELGIGARVLEGFSRIAGERGVCVPPTWC